MHCAKWNRSLSPTDTVAGSVLIPIYQSSDSDVKGSDTSHMCRMCGPSRHPLILLQPPRVTRWIRDKTSGHRQLCLAESPWYSPIERNSPLWFVVLLIMPFIIVPCYNNVNLKKQTRLRFGKINRIVSQIRFRRIDVRLYVVWLVNFSLGTIEMICPMCFGIICRIYFKPLSRRWC